MPLLRIVCPPERTDRIVTVLLTALAATEISVVAGAGRPGGGDLILAEVPRADVDALLRYVREQPAPAGVHVAAVPSTQLLPVPPPSEDEDAVVWAEVTQDLQTTGRLSWINLLLMMTASSLAAVGIMQDQLLLIVGAMVISPDYYPIASTALALSRLAWADAWRGGLILAAGFGAAIGAACLLTLALSALGLVSADAAPAGELTLFISRPDRLSVVVALIAGVAGALAVTLPGARGLVGVFVSVTTIPAAANIGVAIAALDLGELVGASIQLLTNVAGLLVAGAITLALRHRGAARRVPGVRLVGGAGGW